MGLDVSGHMIIGFRVTEDVLFVQDEVFDDGCEQCPKDRSEKRKFCSNCGKKFVPKKVKRPTKGLAKLIKKQGWEPMETVDFYDLEGLVHNVNPHQTCEDENRELAVGSALAGTGSNRGFSSAPCSSSWPVIERTRGEVLKMAEILGLKDVTVDIFITIYYSY
jgi:hypothetical protein